VTSRLDSPRAQRLLAAVGVASALAIVPMLFVAERLARVGLGAAIWLVPAAALVSFACGLGVRWKLLKVLLFSPIVVLVVLFGETWL